MVDYKCGEKVDGSRFIFCDYPGFCDCQVLSKKQAELRGTDIALSTDLGIFLDTTLGNALGTALNTALDHW